MSAAESRAAIYGRLSKNRKGKKANTADQERDCLAYIEEQGWQHVDSYIDDGVSASDKSEREREAFARMMADLRAGLIDVIVASEFTCLYRRPRELEELLDPVDKFHYDVELVTVDPRVRRWDIRTGIGRSELRGQSTRRQNTRITSLRRSGTTPSIVPPMGAGMVGIRALALTTPL